MSLMDKLLACDAKKVLAKETKSYEVKRLSKKLGVPFILKLESIDSELFAEISENNVTYSKSGKVKNASSFKMAIELIAESAIEPDFKNKEFQKKFGCITPTDLISKLFLPVELGDISNEITKLCGLDTNENEIGEQVKN